METKLDTSQIADFHRETVRSVDPSVSREVVKSVVRECGARESIDPAPNALAEREAEGEKKTGAGFSDGHYPRQQSTFSLIDCGLSQFVL